MLILESLTFFIRVVRCIAAFNNTYPCQAEFHVVAPKCIEVVPDLASQVHRQSLEQHLMIFERTPVNEVEAYV